MHSFEWIQGCKAEKCVLLFLIYQLSHVIWGQKTTCPQKAFMTQSTQLLRKCTTGHSPYSSSQASNQITGKCTMYTTTHLEENPPCVCLSLQPFPTCTSPEQLDPSIRLLKQLSWLFLCSEETLENFGCAVHTLKEKRV